MREEYYEWLSQLLFLVCGNMRYQMMVIICIINERRVLWMFLLVYGNMRHKMMVIIYLMEQWYYEWLSLWIVDNFALLL